MKRKTKKFNTKKFKRENPRINTIYKDKPKLIINYGIAETISKCIIDKIISNVIISSKNNDMNKQTKEYYFNYINKLIDPVISMSFLNHENYIINGLQENKNNIGKNINTWIEIEEPKIPIPDRFVTVKIKPLSDKNEKIISKLNENNNIPINESTEFKRLSLCKSSIKKSKIQKVLKFNKMIENNDIIVKKLLKKEIPTMTYSDLEKEKYENIFNHETLNNRMRKEKKEKEEREKELMKIELEQNLKILENKKENKPKQRNFDSRLLTFDSNGKIIKKLIQKESNFIKDFNFINIKINESKLLNPFRIHLSQTQVESNKNRKNNIALRKNLRKKTFNKSIIIENDNKIKEDDIKTTKEEEIDNKIKNIMIGNNSYTNINPEIGVVVKNEKDSYIKTGGNNFSLKYHKQSIKDFNDLLFKTSLLNSQHYSKSNTNNSENNNTSNGNMKEFNGYIPSYNEKNKNPLIDNAYSPIFKNMKIISQINKNIGKRNLSYSNYNQKIQKSNSTFELNNDGISNLNEMNTQKSIKLNNLTKTKSLFNLMSDPNEEYNDIRSYIISQENKNLINNKSFLSYNINTYSEKKFPLINNIRGNTENKNNKNSMMNNFNSRILSNKKWGVIENEANEDEFSNLLSNNFRKPNFSNKIKLINEKRLGKINTRKRNIYLMHNISNDSYFNKI